MRPPLPVPPPPDPTQDHHVHFYKCDVDTPELKHIHDRLTEQQVIRGIRRSFRIRPFSEFFINGGNFSATMDCAYIIEDYTKTLYVVVMCSSATLHYTDLNEPLRSNWDNSDMIGDNLLFSPSSSFVQLRGTWPTSSWPNHVMHFEKLNQRMPWFNKVEKLHTAVLGAMYNIAQCIRQSLAIMHSAAVLTTYSERFGKYFNGYLQLMEPVVGPYAMEMSVMDTFPMTIAVNPAQFVRYTKIIGDHPRMTLYRKYARYEFARVVNTSCQPVSSYIAPMEMPVASDVVIGNYSPTVKLWSFEEFCKRCDKIDEHVDDTDKKSIKEFIDKVIVDSNALGHNYALNKFPEHTR